MAGFGWFNPFPMQFGGDETPIEDVDRTLRSVVGKTTVSNEEGILALWRNSLAYGIGLVSQMNERVALQVFPRLSTDLLPYYERVLQSYLPPVASDEERRTDVGARWTAQAKFLQSDLEAGLQLIDASYSILTPEDDETAVTEWGRWFQDLLGTLPFGLRESTLFANYSTHFVMTAVFDNGGGSLSPEDELVILSGRRLLSAALPAWMLHQVVTSVGFNLDEDPLDYTALSP